MAALTAAWKWCAGDSGMRTLQRVSLIALSFGATSAFADPAPSNFQGVPEQVIPTYPEVGAPTFTTPSGAASFSGLQSGTGTGAGGTDPAAEAGGGSDALAQMSSASWGSAAAANAQAIGVSATALAATCVMESGCATNTTISGTISGTFQMADSTYLQMMSEVAARDPSLAATLPAGLAGKNDPAVQSVAAAQYLYDAAKAEQSAGIANPTFLDTRSYFQFGPSAGKAVALADPGALLSSYLNLTPAQYTANGINPATTTVGQWRQSVTSKVGTAATSSVLSS